METLIAHADDDDMYVNYRNTYKTNMANVHKATNALKPSSLRTRLALHTRVVNAMKNHINK